MGTVNLAGIITGHPDYDIYEKEVFYVSPNPAKETISISLADKTITSHARVQFINASGQTVKEMPFSDQISLSGIKPGFYEVLVITEAQVFKKSIIISQ